MIKRLLLFLGSIFLVVFLSVNVYAAGLTVDYAHNVNATDGNDSLNYLVSSTSDGGYLVGTCMLSSGSYVSASWYDKINECEFYLSKYKVDGSREWISAVETTSPMISIGEMANDYRVMTEDGVMIVYDEDSGQYVSSVSVGQTQLWGAAFYTDDTVIAYGDRDLYRYDKDGSQIGVFPFEYGDGGYCNFNLATFSNGDFAFACGEAANTLVRVSRDLTRSEVLFDLNGSAWIMAIDEDEYALTTLGVCDRENVCTYTHTSYDMSGNTLASMQTEGSATDMSIAFIGGYYFVNNNEHTIKKMSPEFEPIFEYTFDANEAFYAATSLKDRSMVGVGVSSTMTINYSINSENNGIYYRWIDEDVPVLAAADNGGIENPSTLDDVSTVSLVLITSVTFILAIGLRRKR